MIQDNQFSYPSFCNDHRRNLHLSRLSECEYHLLSRNDYSGRAVSVIAEELLLSVLVDRHYHRLTANDPKPGPGEALAAKYLSGAASQACNIVEAIHDEQRQNKTPTLEELCDAAQQLRDALSEHHAALNAREHPTKQARVDKAKKASANASGRLMQMIRKREAAGGKVTKLSRAE